MADFTWQDALEIYGQAARANPRNYSQYQRLDDDWENTPVYDMLESSPGLNLARQYLPESVGKTQAGRWLLNQLPQPKESGSAVDKARNILSNLPLGGYSKKQRDEYSEARAGDARLQRYTVERGKVPDGLGSERDVGDSSRAAMAQAAGAATADFVSDGARNIWWFLNAPQALASIAVLQGLATTAPELKAEAGVAGKVPWIKNRNLRMAATVPAWIGTSIAIGNAARLPGYKAAVPSEADPTQAVDPITEGVSRYFLGRTGSLLPYDEFVKERPDVSKSEYDAYKSYLFGSAMPIKATLDGIHGPEVTFMGKSIPVATGVLPAIAAVIGARHGIRKAGRKLTASSWQDGEEKGRNLLARAETLRKEYKEAKPDDKENAYLRYAQQQDANEGEILKQSLLYSSGAMGATALAGQTLESIRRALKGNAPIEDPEEDQSSLPALR